MTRKTCNNYLHVDIILQSVCHDFCCFGDLLVRVHGSAPQQTLIGSHFPCKGLDGLYRAASNSDFYLKINGTEFREKLRCLKLPIQHFTGFGIPMTRNKMPRTRTSSVCDKAKQSPLSPTGHDFGHRLRTRRHTSFINSFGDTSGDDDSNHIKPLRELRSASKSFLTPPKAVEHDLDTWDSGRPKRTCIKQKRISADERLVVDNKNYYKVEVMTNKLRSSGNAHREPETPPVRKKIKSPPPLVSEESEDDKGLIVKFRKLRNSELTRLNNEAENFLFPHKDESSSEDDTDVAAPVNSKKGENSPLQNSSSRPSKTCKSEPEEETSMDSTSSEVSVTRKKRRLTQAEAFILDNQRYYKFETPGSRLRYQGSYLAPIASKNNGEYSTKHSRSREPVEKVKPKLNLEELQFSFEMVPKTEPWYKTFQRQDNGEESYSCYHYPAGFYKPFLLPYEMGRLPPLDPRVCVYAYNQMKKRFLSETIAATIGTCSTPDSCSADTTKTDYNSSTGEDTKSSEDSMMGSEFAENFFQKSKSSKQSHSRREVPVPSKNPRKSPRQHASTLAILSSLIQQRKRRDMHKSRGSDPNTSKQNLSSIEEEKDTQDPEPDYDTVAKNIDDMLSSCSEQMDSLDILMSDSANVDMHYKPDVIEMLEDYVNCGEDHDISTSTAKVVCDTSVVRKPNRKKKKNRTGWPNKHRRAIFRKEGSDSRDGLAGSEHESSVVDSLSGHPDLEENEENSEDNNCNRNSKNLSLSKLSSYIENTISPTNRNDGRGGGAGKINGDVQANKFNGINDSFELSFKSLGTPRRKEHRESSSDNSAEVVLAGDKIDSVNVVDLAKWENAERVLAAKLRSEAINNDIQFQPIVRVQKLDSDIAVKHDDKRGQNSPSPRRTRPRRMPASPKSPRMLRRPRGGWYRERY